MQSITATELRKNWHTIIHRCEKGEEFTVTRYGKIIGNLASSEEKMKAVN